MSSFVIVFGLLQPCPRQGIQFLLYFMLTAVNAENLLFQVREIYTKCTVELVTDTQPFKESMQLLNFQSQVRLIETIKSALKVINTTLQIVSPVKPLRSTPTKNNLNNINLNEDLGENFLKTVRVHLLLFSRQIENANTEVTVLTEESVDPDVENVPANRYKLKQVTS